VEDSSPAQQRRRRATRSNRAPWPGGRSEGERRRSTAKKRGCRGGRRRRRSSSAKSEVPVVSPPFLYRAPVQTLSHRRSLVLTPVGRAGVGLVRWVVDEVAAGRSPSIVLHRYQNYCCYVAADAASPSSWSATFPLPTRYPPSPSHISANFNQLRQILTPACARGRV
jgi:hypothetical protein